MKIINETKNALLNRREVNVLIESASNPGIDFCKESIAKHFKTEKTLVVVKRLNSHYGKSEFTVDAIVYDNEKAMSIEPKPKVKKAVAQ